MYHLLIFFKKSSSLEPFEFEIHLFHIPIIKRIYLTKDNRRRRRRRKIKEEIPQTQVGTCRQRRYHVSF